MMGNSLLVFLIVEFASRKHNLISGLNRQPLWFRWAIYLELIFSILIFGYYGDATTQEFVYFRFVGEILPAVESLLRVVRVNNNVKYSGYFKEVRTGRKR